MRGELGEIYYAKALDARRRGVPTWGDYMRKERNGGGILFDGAPHSLDMTMYLMNNFKPVSVFGRVFDKMRAEVDGNPWGVWDPTQSNVEDTGFAMITMEGGAVVYLEAAWLINMIGYANSTLLVGTKAGVDMQGQNGNVRVNKIYNGKDGSHGSRKLCRRWQHWSVSLKSTIATHQASKSTTGSKHC